MINLIHSFSNIVTTARIASGCDVKAGGAQSLQTKIMGYAYYQNCFNIECVSSGS